MVGHIRTTLRTVACLLILAIGGLAQAGPYTVGGGWADFNWGKKDPKAWNAEGAFTFTTTKDTVLSVTDAFDSGDRFEVYNFGALLATTTKPASGSHEESPDKAFQHKDFSIAYEPLTPGNYSLTFKTIENAPGFDWGTAYFRVDEKSAGGIAASDTPEPASLALAGLGLAAVAGHRAWRRRREPR